MWSLLQSHSSSWNLVERLCFPAPPPSYTLKSFPNELIVIPRADGFKVPCLFMPFKHARFLLIYFHGNAEDLGLCHQFCSHIRDQFQVHMLAIEYPGYGIAGGQCDEEQIMANAVAAMKFVTLVLQWPLDGIKLLGRSLGTGPAIAVAMQWKVAGVILVSPFVSIREVFRGQIGKLADLITERFPNLERMDRIRSPTLIIHGQQDTLIPREHGERLFNQLRVKKMMVCPVEMGHNTPLLGALGIFVLPMIEFFSLPDYAFEDIKIPDWAFPAVDDDDLVDIPCEDEPILESIDKLPHFSPRPPLPSSIGRLDITDKDRQMSDPGRSPRSFIRWLRLSEGSSGGPTLASPRVVGFQASKSYDFRLPRESAPVPRQSEEKLWHAIDKSIDLLVDTPEMDPCGF